MTLTLVTLALVATPDSVPASLKAREAALGVTSTKTGLGKAVGSLLSSDGVIVFPGAPVVVGKEKIVSLLAAQPGLDSVSAEWTDLESWIAKDGTMAATIGQSKIAVRSGGAPRAGTYIVVWTKAGGDWRIAGLLMTGLVRPGSTVLPEGLGPVALPPARAAGPAKAFVQADLDFAKLAGARGAPEAFRFFAAPNAIVQAGADARKGPDAIGVGVSQGPPSDWAWFPVVGRAAGSGDLGFTVGQSSIRPKSGGDADLGKYLTIWTRLPDGTVRFLTDGGNARPKP